MQSMVWGPNMIPVEQIDMDALRALPPRDSDEWILALLGRQFPGSWLPFGREQLIRSAEPHFRLVASTSGRLDYIETISQWNRRIGTPSFRKTLFKLQLLPRWLTSADFRLAFTSGVSANKVCFERELLEHYRLVFQKQNAYPFAPFCPFEAVPVVLEPPTRLLVLAFDHEEVPRMTPASLDFCLANLKRSASSAGISIPSESLNPTARFLPSSRPYITLIDRPDS